MGIDIECVTCCSEGHEVRMLRTDLKRGGIPYMDEDGRYSNFNTLRYTTALLLAANGVNPKVVQTSMRHSDIPSKAQRKGVFTSGIVSIVDDHRIALFFTGHQHAGKNLADLLKQRAAELDKP